MKDKTLKRRIKFSAASIVILLLLTSLANSSLTITDDAITESDGYLTLSAGTGINISSNTIIDGNLTINENFTTPYEDAITIAKSGGDYTSIQTALDENPTASKVFLVYPGTYTDTIHFTANKQVVEALGHAQNVIVQQADANVVDVGNYTGCLIKFLQIKLTAPTTCINMIQAYNGFLGSYSCKLVLTTTSNLTCTCQPSIANVLGEGLIKTKLGEFHYTHSGNTTNGIKAPFIISGENGTIQILRPCKSLITNSGTANVTAMSYTNISATIEISNICGGVITDYNASIVTSNYYDGDGVVGSAELSYSILEVIGGDSNSAYGIYNDGGIDVKSSHNIFNITSTGSGAYSFYIGTGSTLTSHFDDIIAADGLQDNGEYNAVNSLTDGELDITGDLNIIGDATINYGGTYRTAYDTDHNHYHEQLKVGGYWFDTKTIPGLNIEDNFLGVRGEKDRLQSAYQYAVRSNDDKPKPSSNDTTGGALKINTDTGTNDYCYVANGDKDNIIHPWNMSKDITVHMHFKLGDTTNKHAFVGVGTESETSSGNFTGIRFNTALAGAYGTNIYFVANNGTGETNVSLGAADTDWHEFWMKISEGQVIYSFDEAAINTVTTNTPSNDVLFTWLAFVQNLDSAEESIYIKHLIITQSD